MIQPTDELALLRISKSVNSNLKAFKAGVHLEAATGRTIDDLHQQTCADRLQLAFEFGDAADRLMRSRPPMYRVAVGRYYYSMYHSMRAVSHFRHFGDDYEQHSVLPSKTPADFNQRAFWENELKDARLRRNEADYDPYPRSDTSFRAIAMSLRVSARQLAIEAKKYLLTKGCAHL